MSAPLTWHRLLAGLLLVSLNLPVAAEESGELPRGVIRLDETVISGNQELPKVLYILPWRDPNGLPEIELDASYSEMDVFRRLYPPAYRRELTYFESLETAEDAGDSATGAGKQR